MLWPSLGESTGAPTGSSIPRLCDHDPTRDAALCASSLVAKLVHMEFPQNSIACIGLSAALPKSQLAIARDVASSIGITLREVATKVRCRSHRRHSTFAACTIVCDAYQLGTVDAPPNGNGHWRPPGVDNSVCSGR